MKVEVEVVKDGSRRMMHRQLAKVLAKKGLVRYAEDKESAAPMYETRMLQARPSYDVKYSSNPETAAPYGYKADGTPRLRPGRPAKAE